MSEVRVVPYDPAWRTEFEDESEAILAALGANAIAIHHIGSTSIPGIYAKPVIDIMVEVTDLSAVDARSEEMERLGYEAKGEFGIEGRRYFRKDNAQGIRTHQIHVFERGSDHLRRHLAFRDHLISNPDDANAYSELKRELAARYPDSMDDYIDGKDAFIKDVDRRAK